MTPNVVPGPWKQNPANNQSAFAHEIDRVEGQFRKMGRRDADVFEHLARKVYRYLADVEQAGAKSGRIGWIIAGDTDQTARHRKRFSWNGDLRDFKKEPLCKNPGQWLAVLKRCAQDRNQPAEELLLEAFAGSRIRPATLPTDFTEASWLGAFLDIMRALEQKICDHSDALGLLSYISAAHLEFDDAKTITESVEPILPYFRADLPEWSEILDQIPYTQICTNWVGDYVYQPDLLKDSDEKAAWMQLIEGCGAAHLMGTHHFSISALIRRGIAIIPGEESERPRLAIFKWPVARFNSFEIGIDWANTVFNEIEIPSSCHVHASKILFRSNPEYEPHLIERVTFAPLGSSQFNAIVCEAFRELYGSVGGFGENCWDPMYADEGTEIDYASAAPKATVAAMIERNLLFADAAGVPEQRLDRLLENDIRVMAEAVRAYRKQIDEIVGPARQKLLAGLAPTTKSKDENK